MFASHGYKNSVISASDPNFKNVTLLLHGDGTNGAQNNTFLDSSTNNFAITRTGTPTQGSFSPYGNRWSNYFDGTGDYLDAPSNAAFQFGTGEFTIEFWVYLNEYKTCNFIDFRSGAINQVAPLLYLTTTGSLRYSVSVIDRITSTNAIPLYSWTHIALSKSGTSTRMFVNGVQSGSTYTDNNNYILSPCRIGTSNNGNATDTTNLCVNGYISNVRVVKGTALYTGTFTPPISNLTAVAGTSLLTCQSNRFVDNSSNNFTITANGTPSVQPNSPFNPTNEYSIATNGGSGHFDGSGDYMDAPSNAAFQFGTGDFTIEFWAYFNLHKNFNELIDFRNGTITSQYAVVLSGTSTGQIRFLLYGAIEILSTNAIPLYSWTHIALSRSGTSVKMFLNGIENGSTLSPENYIQAPCRIGSSNNGVANDSIIRSMDGYISDVRVVKGTALYTGTFTPPTSPLTAIANTSLLCGFTNAGIFDNAAKNNLLTVGTSRISTAEKKFGTGSILFNGSTDYCRTIAAAGTHQFGTGDFTIECWAYCTNLAGGNAGVMEIIDFRSAASNEARPTLAITSSSFIYFTAGIGKISSGTISANNWYHVAIVRYSGNTKLYVNGTNVGVTYADTNKYLDGTPTIGNYLPNPVYGFAGYIDDVRITKGIAVYTSNFTPPTQAFPNL